MVVMNIFSHRTPLGLRFGDGEGNYRSLREVRSEKKQALEQQLANEMVQYERAQSAVRDEIPGLPF